MKSEAQPVQLMQFLLPGLEMAVRSGIDQMNQICISLGLPPYELSRENGSKPPRKYQHSEAFLNRQGKIDRRPEMSAASREAIAAAQRRRWAKIRGEKVIDAAGAPASAVAFPIYKKGEKRFWTAEQKAEAVRQYEALAPGTGGSNPGERAAFMKKHKISSNMIYKWRSGNLSPSRTPAKRKIAKHVFGKGATVVDMVAWAKKHDNLFNVDAFKSAHPGLHMRALGRVVVNGFFKRAGEREFKLTAKGESQ